jgi:hypothetical protein
VLLSRRVLTSPRSRLAVVQDVWAAVGLRHAQIWQHQRDRLCEDARAPVRLNRQRPLGDPLPRRGLFDQRNRAPRVPGWVHASVSRNIFSLYSAENRRRVAMASTSTSFTFLAVTTTPFEALPPHSLPILCRKSRRWQYLSHIGTMRKTWIFPTWEPSNPIRQT